MYGIRGKKYIHSVRLLFRTTEYLQGYGIPPSKVP